LAFGEEVFALQDFGGVPADGAVEAEDEGGGAAAVFGAAGDLFGEVGKELVGDPVEVEGDLTLLALDEGDAAIQGAAQPVDEVVGGADGGGEEHDADVGWQKGEGEFPDDAALGFVEVVELVHDDGLDVREIEGFGVEEAVEEDFGDDDLHRGVGVDGAVA